MFAAIGDTHAAGLAPFCVDASSLRQAWPCGGSCRGGRLCRLRWVWRPGAGAAELTSRLQRSVQTAAASQLRSAPLARPAPDRQTQPPRKVAPTGPGLPRQPRSWHATDGTPTMLRPRRVSPGCGVPLRGAEKRRCRGQRAQRASSSYLRRLFERNVSAETCSEFRRVATASSIAGEPVHSAGHLASSAAAWAGPSWLTNPME